FRGHFRQRRLRNPAHPLAARTRDRPDNDSVETAISTRRTRAFYRQEERDAPSGSWMSPMAPGTR
ncbi:MAG: hypothetical protein QF593_04895, partial [Nitrospinota bacterium]|nr:hypothetical protein [Nitrospinota bacterium]